MELFEIEQFLNLCRNIVTVFKQMTICVLTKDHVLMLNWIVLN